MAGRSWSYSSDGIKEYVQTMILGKTSEHPMS